jgi:DNA-binding MarR family transcriptional regulator
VKRHAAHADGAPADASPAPRAAEVRAALKHFRVIFSSVRRHFAVVERACGVGGAQVWALAAMAARPGLRVGDLAESLSIHQSTASNLVDKLIRRGFARRRRDRVDRRVVRLELTAKGRRLIGRAPRPLEGVLPDALKRLPPAALARLDAELALLIRTMQLKDDRAAYTPLAHL